MIDSVNDKFEDPVLKSAVRRCWACECAPAELRERVRGLLQAGDVADMTADRPLVLRFPRSTWLLAMAALVALVIGVSLRYRTPAKPQNPVVASITLPSSLQTDLVIRHDLCCQEADHQHLPAAKNDDAAIASALQSRLFRAVLVAHPTDPGWNFRGAAICPVGAVPAGHLVFVRGVDTLSIFSLPGSVAPGLHDGDQFSMSANGHSIVGFAKDRALFCLVGNSPTGTLNIGDLQKMRMQMEPDVTIARADSPERVAVADLLRSADH